MAMAVQYYSSMTKDVTQTRNAIIFLDHIHVPKAILKHTHK